MSVFLPRENIFFIEEWLRYHIAIGCEHFYLYNNMGSRWLDCGNNLEVTGKNKRGESIYALLADKSDEEIADDLNRVLAPFVERGYVTQLPWQPRDEDGNITYAYYLAAKDYIENYADQWDWTSFIDIDEFILPLRHGHTSSLLGELEQRGFNYVVMFQKAFPSRFTPLATQPVPEVLRQTVCHPQVLRFGKKTIIKTDILRVEPTEYAAPMHNPPVHDSRRRVFEDSDVVRFNHYKFSQRAREWVRDHGYVSGLSYAEARFKKTKNPIHLAHWIVRRLRSKPNFYLNSIDEEILRIYERAKAPHEYRGDGSRNGDREEDRGA